MISHAYLHNLARLLTLATLATAATACHVEREPNWEWLPWINHMVFSSAAEANSKSPVSHNGEECDRGTEGCKTVFANGQTNQIPPKGTIPRGFMPLHYTSDDAGRKDAESLKNPFEATPENLARGAERFAIFCTPCHGKMGGGDGLVAKRGIAGMPLNIPKRGVVLPSEKPLVSEMPDGHIFHIMSYGRGNMPSYASQIAQEDRWKIILHLRTLQVGNVAAATK